LNYSQALGLWLKENCAALIWRIIFSKDDWINHVIDKTSATPCLIGADLFSLVSPTTKRQKRFILLHLDDRNGDIFYDRELWNLFFECLQEPNKFDKDKAEIDFPELKLKVNIREFFSGDEWPPLRPNRLQKLLTYGDGGNAVPFSYYCFSNDRRLGRIGPSDIIGIDGPLSRFEVTGNTVKRCIIRRQSRRATLYGFALNVFYYSNDQRLKKQFVFENADNRRLEWVSREGNGKYPNPITAFKKRQREWL
jgi:hypothetical protein